MNEFSYQPPSSDEMREMQRRWEEVRKPGKMHGRLEYFIGKWSTSTKVWMGGPGSQPIRSSGSSEFRWLIDGYWICQEHKGEFAGMPERGFGIHGYDNFRKRFVGCWVDNMSTALSTMDGNLDKSGNVLIEYGAMDEPMTREIGKRVKYATRIIDGDNFVFEIHDLGIGEQNTIVVEIKYARVT